jgi:hypothetical protein
VTSLPSPPPWRLPPQLLPQRPWRRQPKQRLSWRLSVSWGRGAHHGPDPARRTRNEPRPASLHNPMSNPNPSPRTHNYVMNLSNSPWSPPRKFVGHFSTLTQAIGTLEEAAEPWPRVSYFQLVILMSFREYWGPDGNFTQNSLRTSWVNTPPLISPGIDLILIGLAFPDGWNLEQDSGQLPMLLQCAGYAALLGQRKVRYFEISKFLANQRANTSSNI